MDSKRIVFDIEANGLLRDGPKGPAANRMWCMVAEDVDTNETIAFYDGGPLVSDDVYGGDLRNGIDYLCDASVCIGHNIIGFDIPLVRKLTGIHILSDRFDTLVVSKLLYPDRPGGHSLDAWGKRLGRNKPEHEDWTRFSPEMLHRCKEDVAINRLLFDKFAEATKYYK